MPLRSIGRTIRLLYDQHAFGLRVEIVKEIVASWRDRADIDHALAVAGHDLLDAERYTFKLHRRGVEILDPDRDRSVGRCVQLGGLEAMILDRNLYRRGLRQRVLRADPDDEGHDKRSGRSGTGFNARSHALLRALIQS